MPRTINEAAHALRRDEFLDVTQRLLETKGYEQMSIQDVLTATGASKGSLYHYFGSKQALLQAVVERLADRTAAVLAPVADDPGLSALEKLRRFFGALASWKVQRRELLVALLRVWHSDDNAVVRQKLRHGIADRVAPLLAVIVDQGEAEGVFTAAHPNQLGRVIVSLVQDLNDRLADLFITYGREGGDLRDVEDTVSAYTEALQRILGVPGGSVVLVEMATLRPWFERERDPEGKSA
jgi:AcrR family transcriptional regulator